MKVTTFFLFGILFQVSAAVFSQNSGLISLKAENESLKEILSLVEYQSKYRFLYNSNNINVEQKKNINCKSKSIKEVLDILLKDTGIEYRSFESTYVLFSKERDRQISERDLSSTFSQQRAISGKVTDSDGLPLPGVTVVIKATTQGTITNNNGEYTLGNVSEDAVLVFSFVGMQTQEIEIGTQTTINVTMVEETFGVDEVVVVGYGTQRRVNLTGAVSTLSTDDLANRPVTNSAQLMYGQFSGVQLTQNTGLPGDDQSSVVIRGVGTFGDATPLVVIDGIQYSGMGEFNNLSPSDMESITVLKDASASAIYGARGANGVIVVTTKKGKVDASRVEYNGYYGFQEVTVVPEFLDAINYAELFNEKAKNEAGGGSYLPRYTEEQLEMIRTGSNPDQFANTNWVDLVFRTAPVQNHYLSISGGRGKTSYAVSTGYLDQDAILVGKFSSKRYNLRFNLSSQVGEWLDINNTLSGWWKKFNGPAGGDNAFEGDHGVIYQFARAAPTIPAYYSNGEYGYVDGAYQNDYPSLGTNNPVKRLNWGNYEADNIQVSERLGLTVHLAKGLSFETSGSLRLNVKNISNFSPTDITRDYDGVVMYINDINSLSNTFDFNYRLLNENILRYAITLNEVHDLKFMVGQ